MEIFDHVGGGAMIELSALRTSPDLRLYRTKSR